MLRASCVAVDVPVLVLAVVFVGVSAAAALELGVAGGSTRELAKVALAASLARACAALLLVVNQTSAISCVAPSVVA